MSIANNFLAPTPKNWKIASLILKSIAIATTLVLPPLGIISIGLGSAIAGLASIGSVVCSTAVDKGSLEALTTGLELIEKQKQLNLNIK